VHQQVGFLRRAEVLHVRREVGQAADDAPAERMELSQPCACAICIPSTPRGGILDLEDHRPDAGSIRANASPIPAPSADCAHSASTFLASAPALPAGGATPFRIARFNRQAH
jgi:hypothetical protein